MDSPAFCGQVCHTTMEPQFTACTGLAPRQRRLRAVPRGSRRRRTAWPPSPSSSPQGWRTTGEPAFSAHAGRLGPARPRAAEDVLVFREGGQPRERSGRRQDGPALAGQHRRHRARARGLSGRCRARLHDPGSRQSNGRSPRCVSFWTARTGPSPTPPATRASTIISSTCRPAGAPGTASCRQSIRPFCSPACLTAAAYFDAGQRGREREVRALADALYRRADWQWAQNGGATVTHGWKPESGFLPYRWEGYDEALMLYVLGLGSPTLSAARESYAAWTSTYEWKKHLRPRVSLCRAAVHASALAPLDRFPRHPGCLHARQGHRLFREQPPRHLRAAAATPSAIRTSSRGYGEHCWGITASDGPGPDDASRSSGVERRFFGYLARGVPYGPDDGTLAPWAVVASLPFAPEIVLPALRYFSEDVDLEQEQSLRLQGHVQPDLPGRNRQPLRLGVAVALRSQPGADRADDRKPSQRPCVAPAPREYLAGERLARGRVHRRLVGLSRCRSSLRGSLAMSLDRAADRNEAAARVTPGNLNTPMPSPARTRTCARGGYPAALVATVRRGESLRPAGRW